MSDLKGVVVTHGSLAGSLVDAVSKITGIDGALLSISNDGCAGDDLTERIADVIESDEAVVFVDLPVGSCLNAAVRRMKQNGNMTVVAGVNLTMLVDFVYNRDKGHKVAAERAVEKGVESIKALNGDS